MMESELLVTLENCSKLVGKKVVIVIPMEKDRPTGTKMESSDAPKLDAGAGGDDTSEFHNSHDKFDRQIIVSNQINLIESWKKCRCCVWV